MPSEMFPEIGEREQRVLITAGGDGLGLSIAQRFRAAGASVHIGDPSAEALARTLGENPGLHGTVGSVAEPDAVRELVAEAVEWMGGVDVLVNCARDPGPRAALEEIEDDDWHRVLAINLSGMFYAIRAVAPLMKSQLGGAIVNVGSYAGRTGAPRRAAYAAAKAGVLGLTRNVARELGPSNVRCNVVLPGMIRDDYGRRLVRVRARVDGVALEDAEARLLSSVSMRTWVEPEEIADTVVFLASPAARHITGQTIGVCGNLEGD